MDESLYDKLSVWLKKRNETAPAKFGFFPDIDRHAAIVLDPRLTPDKSVASMTVPRTCRKKRAVPSPACNPGASKAPTKGGISLSRSIMPSVASRAVKGRGKKVTEL